MVSVSGCYCNYFMLKTIVLGIVELSLQPSATSLFPSLPLPLAPFLSSPVPTSPPLRSPCGH